MRLQLALRMYRVEVVNRKCGALHANCIGAFLCVDLPKLNMVTKATASPQTVHRWPAWSVQAAAMEVSESSATDAPRDISAGRERLNEAGTYYK